MAGLGTHLGCPFPSNTKKSGHSNEDNCIPPSLTVPKLIFLFIPICYPRTFHQPVPIFSPQSQLTWDKRAWLGMPLVDWFSPSAYLLKRCSPSPSPTRTTDLCGPPQGHPLELIFAGRWKGRRWPEAFSGLFPIPPANYLQITSGRVRTESPRKETQTMPEHVQKESLELCAEEERHEKYEWKQQKREGRGRSPPSWLLKLHALTKTTDTCAQERTWTTTSSCGGKGGFVEHFPVQGNGRRAVLLAQWPAMACLVPWCAHGEWWQFSVVWVGFLIASCGTASQDYRVFC